MTMRSYMVSRTSTAPPMEGDWHSAPWRDVAAARIDQFHPQGSDHRPEAAVKLLYDAERIYGRFRVSDHYVVARQTQYQDPVCKDSCVEFFVQPTPDKGYFNFELNCCGVLLLSHVTNPGRDAAGRVHSAVPISEDWGKKVVVAPTLSGPILEERSEAITWQVGFSIPLALLEAHVGTLGDPAGQVWRANFYKCADGSSHPHWASWNPAGERLDFHQPAQFGRLEFE